MCGAVCCIVLHHVAVCVAVCVVGCEGRDLLCGCRAGGVGEAAECGHSGVIHQRKLVEGGGGEGGAESELID